MKRPKYWENHRHQQRGEKEKKDKAD